jgi:hypothetical protein
VIPNNTSAGNAVYDLCRSSQEFELLDTLNRLLEEDDDEITQMHTVNAPMKNVAIDNIGLVCSLCRIK